MYHLVSLAAKTALVATTSLSAHASAPAAYTVQPGDTLGTIAASNGTTWQAVYAANRTVIGGDPNVIAVGEQLVLSASGVGQSAAQSAVGTSQAGSIPSSYFSCVRFRESTNGAASGDQFGITPSSWSAYGFPGSPYSAPYNEQVTAFQRIYAAVGTSAWSPYDGC
jgi:LysM repeat protein